MTKALKIWMDLPADIRSKILSNVWCPDCRTAVTICDYNADFHGGVVVTGKQYRENGTTAVISKSRLNNFANQTGSQPSGCVVNLKRMSIRALFYP